MIHYFVLFLILTAASSIGAFSLLQMNQSTQALIKAQSERQNLDMVEYALINKLEALGTNQGLAAPVGVQDSTDADGDGNPDIPHQLLPNGLGIKKTNAWGRPLVYCPHYPEAIDFSVSTQSVWSGKNEGDSSSYLAGTVTDHAGVEYVVQADQILDSSLAGQKVIAMILSPLPSSASAPSCSEVTYDSNLNEYRVPNGIVRVIEQSNSVAYLAGGRTVTVVDSDDYVTQNLNVMLDKVGANKPDLIMLDLSANASSYNFESNYSFQDVSPGNNRAVVIEGDGKGSTTIGASSPITLTFDGVDVLIRNIKISDNVKVVVKNGELTTDNAELSQTKISDSEWFIKNNVEIIDNGTSGLALQVISTNVHQGNASVLLKGGSAKSTIADLTSTSWLITNGQLTIETTESLTSGMSLNSSEVRVDSGTVQFQRDSAAQFKTEQVFVIGPMSTLFLHNSNFINTYPAIRIFNVKGSIVFDNSSLASSASIDTAINATLGATVTIDNGSVLGLNTAPTRGVVDAGLRFALGANSTIYSSSECWTGPVFTDTASKSSGTSDATTPQYEIFNQSIWACNP